MKTVDNVPDAIRVVYEAAIGHQAFLETLFDLHDEQGIWEELEQLNEALRILEEEVL
jgi:hypothetical protein